MPKDLQIGNTIYEYPVQQDGNYGEEATAWAEAVTTSLANVQGPNDITITSATLSNNQAVAANVPGLVFNAGSVQAIRVDYLVIREGTATDTEHGYLEANYNGTDWKITQDGIGDVGVYFTINASGQVQYTSSDWAGHTSTTIRFRARTIDQP